MHRSIRPALILAAAALATAGATSAVAAMPGMGHGSQATPAPLQTVTLRFAAVAGTSPVACGTPIAGLGTTAATAQLRDLRFYVSNVRLMRANGTSAPLRLLKDDTFNLTQGGNRTTLIDLENATGSCSEGDAAMNAVIRGRVPRGVYTGARMYVGVPFPLNHGDTTTAKAPLNVAAMAWSWQSGRKFTKIEVTDPAGATGTWSSKVFNVHLGSTGCVGNPASGTTASCAASNRAAVHLMDFNPATQNIAVDLKALFAGNDVTRNAAGASGCMSGGTDPECAGVFAALDIDWKADGTGTGASGHGHDQTVFRAIAK